MTNPTPKRNAADVVVVPLEDAIARLDRALSLWIPAVSELETASKALMDFSSESLNRDINVLNRTIADLGSEVTRSSSYLRHRVVPRVYEDSRTAPISLYEVALDREWKGTTLLDDDSIVDRNGSSITNSWRGRG